MIKIDGKKYDSLNQIVKANGEFYYTAGVAMEVLGICRSRAKDIVQATTNNNDWSQAGSVNNKFPESFNIQGTHYFNKRYIWIFKEYLKILDDYSRRNETHRFKKSYKDLEVSREIRQEMWDNWNEDWDSFYGYKGLNILNETEEEYIERTTKKEETEEKNEEIEVEIEVKEDKSIDKIALEINGETYYTVETALNEIGRDEDEADKIIRAVSNLDKLNMYGPEESKLPESFKVGIRYFFNKRHIGVFKDYLELLDEFNSIEEAYSQLDVDEVRRQEMWSSWLKDWDSFYGVNGINPIEEWSKVGGW